MSERKANPQTIATEKYRKKMGIKGKSFKLKETLLNDFAKACERKGESQTKVITRLMEQYIKE